MENGAAYDLAIPAAVPRQLEFRDHRFWTAVIVVMCGIAGILSTTTAPDVVVNPDHVMLYFLFLMAGVALLLLAVAAQDHHPHPRVERAAARLDGWIRALLYNEP